MFRVIKRDNKKFGIGEFNEAEERIGVSEEIFDTEAEATAFLNKGLNSNQENKPMEDTEPKAPEADPAPEAPQEEAPAAPAEETPSAPAAE